MNSIKPFLVLCERKMVPIKQRLNNKPVGVKCKALKDLEKGMTNKDVAAKYGVPKNTLSTWVKNKHKLTTSLEKKGMSSSRKSTRCGSYDQIDKAVFHWFVGKSFLFTLLCTTLNIRTKNFRHCFGPEIFNLQGTCIPSPSQILTSLPVMTTLHSASWSAMRK